MNYQPNQPKNKAEFNQKYGGPLESMLSTLNSKLSGVAKSTGRFIRNNYGKLALSGAALTAYACQKDEKAKEPIQEYGVEAPADSTRVAVPTPQYFNMPSPGLPANEVPNQKIRKAKAAASKPGKPGEYQAEQNATQTGDSQYEGAQPGIKRVFIPKSVSPKVGPDLSDLVNSEVDTAGIRRISQQQVESRLPNNIDAPERKYKIAKDSKWATYSLDNGVVTAYIPVDGEMGDNYLNAVVLNDLFEQLRNDGSLTGVDILDPRRLLDRTGPNLDGGKMPLGTKRPIPLYTDDNPFHSSGVGYKVNLDSGNTDGIITVRFKPDGGSLSDAELLQNKKYHRARELELMTNMYKNRQARRDAQKASKPNGVPLKPKF